VRKRGETVVETYTVNCSSPRVARCIERDETLTVPNLVPGSYVITARGKIGVLDCWVATATADVTLGAPTARAVTLTPSGVAGCPRVQQAPQLPSTDDKP
jgi:hypothetical protein